MFYLLTSSFIVGIFLGSLLSLTPTTTAFLFVFVGLFTIVILFRSEPFVVKLGTSVLLLVFGAWRYQLAQPSDSTAWVQSLNDGSEVVLTGQIVADPERVGDVQRLEVGCLKMEDGGRKTDEERILKGKVLIRTHRYPEYHYGDEIEIIGRLETPPEFEDFSYRNYLATRGIYSLMNRPETTLLPSNGSNRTYATLLNFRHRLEEKISQILPEPESSLLAGVVLGVKRNLPEDFYEALQRSGTLHVIVVSGTNVMYVISGLMWLCGFLTRPLQISFVILTLLAYALMVGGGAAVWRATLMGLTTLLALVFGRRRLAQEALFASAAALLLANPMGLWQVGFQLSFAATAGIIFLQDFFDQKLQDLPEKVREGLVTTLAAQIAVLPIITHNFQTFSLVSPLANLLTFSLVPALTIGGAIVALAALLWLPLGKLVAPLLYIPARIFVMIVEISAKFPLAQVETTRVPVLVWAVYYLVLVFMVIQCQKKN
jgi:competence protein ComEC